MSVWMSHLFQIAHVLASEIRSDRLDLRFNGDGNDVMVRGCGTHSGDANFGVLYTRREFTARNSIVQAHTGRSLSCSIFPMPGIAGMFRMCRTPHVYPFAALIG